MTTPSPAITRRHALAATGAAALTSGLGLRPASAQMATIRQGYQTNIWGMPTYYLLKSGALEKRGIKFEEFAVASGNLTMQQMVASQVADLKGRKVANQVGSSVGNIFTDIIAPNAGLRKGDFQEVRMDVNNMVAALAARTVDAMVNVEPYNEIAISEGIGTALMDYSSVDRMPVFMAATPDFVQKSPDTVVAYLKAWHDVAGDFKNNPSKVADVIYSFFASKG